jgi:ATP-dependent RNA helicase DeaD
VDGTVLVTQRAHVVERRYKAATLGRILDVEAPGAALVFCRTRGDVDALTETMNGRGHRAEALHGGMDQSQRERVIGRLRDGAAQLLVATDVAARGLDIDTLTHVINHDVPAAPESYVHRIGRVGRAGREGVAITLAEPKELRLLANIERLTKQSIERVPVPGVADLHAARRARTVEAVRAVLDAGGTERYDDVIDALAPDHDLRAIALAAVALAHDTIHARIDETEIPDASRSERSGRKGSKDYKDSKGYKDKGSRGDKADKGARGGKGGGSKGSPKPGDGGPTGYLFVALGKRAGVRPADLVGAIANESGVSGRDIGPIKIGENHSVVGVPEGSVDDILSSMRTTSIRGKKTKVRRYQE